MKSDKEKAIMMLKTSRGQIEGILKMIDDGRYCIDISNQILASQSLLKKANTLVLKQHLNKCVVEAIKDGNGEEKIDEVVNIISKLVDK